jgi:hypothetical protein
MIVYILPSCRTGVNETSDFTQPKSEPPGKAKASQNVYLSMHVCMQARMSISDDCELSIKRLLPGLS